MMTAEKNAELLPPCGDEDEADVGPYYPGIFAQIALLDTMNSSLPFVSILNTGFGGGTILFVGDVRKDPESSGSPSV